jgi:hypothetical protein
MRVKGLLGPTAGTCRIQDEPNTAKAKPRSCAKGEVDVDDEGSSSWSSNFHVGSGTVSAGEINQLILIN